jgi:site-specific DNA-methyltransferase (adenine-specific)
MRDLDDNSIDFIFTDPPYAITNAKWDKPINWNEYWSVVYDKLKPNGTIAMFACTPFDKILAMSNIDDFKYEYIFVKNHPTDFLNSHRRPLRGHENILIFQPNLSKKDKEKYGTRTYNIYKTQGHKRKVSSAKHKLNTLSNQSELYNKSDNFTDYDSTERFPTTILKDFKSDCQKLSLHPTQKPLALVEHIIKIYTNEGDLVVDPFMGSGTTCVAAKNLNRNFIGIELDKKYFDITEERIKSNL